MSNAKSPWIKASEQMPPASGLVWLRVKGQDEPLLGQVSPSGQSFWRVGGAWGDVVEKELFVEWAPVEVGERPAVTKTYEVGVMGGTVHVYRVAAANEEEAREEALRLYNAPLNESRPHLVVNRDWEDVVVDVTEVPNGTRSK